MTDTTTADAEPTDPLAELRAWLASDSCDRSHPEVPLTAAVTEAGQLRLRSARPDGPPFLDYRELADWSLAALQEVVRDHDALLDAAPPTPTGGQ